MLETGDAEINKVFFFFFPLLQIQTYKEDRHKQIKRITILSGKFSKKVGIRYRGDTKGQRKARKSSLKRWWLRQTREEGIRKGRVSPKWWDALLNLWGVLGCLELCLKKMHRTGRHGWKTGRGGSSRRPEMLCWSLRLYHSTKLMVSSCLEFWEKGPAEVLLWGRGGGWDKSDLRFRAALFDLF